jgi:esterase FrsA
MTPPVAAHALERTFASLSRPQFAFDVAPATLFDERTLQFRLWGIPTRTIAAVRRHVHDMWLEGPGGWAHEWALAAGRFEEQGRWLTASMCYGAAHFPTVASPYRRQMLERQVQCYLRAMKRLPVRFERLLMPTRYRGHEVLTPVHLFQPPGKRKRPLVAISGGSDTGKMEIHTMALVMSQLGGFDVMTMDLPGTYESPVPLAPDSETVVLPLIEQVARTTGATGKALMGISFGGHWAAKLGLQGHLDAAVVLGAPVGHVPMDGDWLAAMPNGMTGIISNAMGLHRLPTPAEAGAMLGGFSLVDQGLFQSATPAPILALNGTADPYIPIGETTIFANLPGATAWQVDGAYHCAIDRIRWLMPGIMAWLRQQLDVALPGDRLAVSLTETAVRRGLITGW